MGSTQQHVAIFVMLLCMFTLTRTGEWKQWPGSEAAEAWQGEMKEKKITEYFPWWVFPYPSVQDKNPSQQSRLLQEQRKNLLWKLHIWTVTCGQVWISATFGGILSPCDTASFLSSAWIPVCCILQHRLQTESNHSCRGSGCDFALPATWKLWD